ncbi:MAG TPA: protein kinase [Verrucomicrobiae bacterium]
MCPECGATLPDGLIEGLCPRCLIDTMLGSGRVFAPSSDFGDYSPPGGATRASGSAPESPVRRWFGDYELLEEIGRGGMGVVFKARQAGLDRLVAVKMILFGQFASEEFQQRFRVEAKAAANLRHPNLVTVHEVGHQDGFHFFSMDYIEGKSLADLVREKPLPARRAARYVKTIAEAIHHAHLHGVLHRDLKPSNVLIDREDLPHVTDFGLAKMTTVDADLTVPGQVLGSPQYLPPEQARGETGLVGPTSDVYSLGAILYCLLTGRPPFLANAVADILFQVERTEPISLRLLNPAVPRDLETICLKCLQKAREARYQTAQELAEELGRYLHNEPIVARPAGKAYKLVRWCRREPKVAALAGATLILLLTGTSLIAWQWRRAEAERQRADDRGVQLRRVSYDTAMKSAYNEWGEGNLQEVITLLKDQRPNGAEEELRGFEWRHLWRLCHPGNDISFPRREQVAGAMCFSPDSRILATYYWNNVLRLWEVAHREKELLTVTNVSGLGGFCSHGEFYIFGTRDGVIRICRPRTGEVVRTIPDAGELVAVAGDGQSVVTIDREDILRVLDAASGRVKFTKPGKGRRRSDYGWGALVAISYDGKALAVVEPAEATQNWKESVTVWEVGTEKALRSLHSGQAVLCLAFCPVGNTLAVGGSDGRVRMWDTETGECKTLDRETPAPRTAEPDPANSSAGIWNPGLARNSKKEAHNLPTLAVAFSADGTTMATAGSDETIELWNVATLGRQPGPIHRPIGVVWSLAFSPDGRRLASGGRNSSVTLWDPGAVPASEGIDGLSSNAWGNFTFSPDSRLLAVACTNDVVKVFEVKDLRLVGTLEGASHVLGFSRDGEDLLTFTSKEIPQWWNVSANTVRQILDFGGRLDDVTAVDLSADRKLAAFGHEDGTIQLVDIGSGKTVRAWQTHPGRILAIGFSPNGQSLYTNRTSTVRLGETDLHAVLSLAFSPRSDKLVSGSRDRSMIVWDLRTQEKLLGNDGDQHRGAVCALAYSPDEKWIASGCGAATIKLWKAANLKAAPTSVSHHKAAILSLDFSLPDGRTLASGSRDGTVRFWNGREPRLDIGSLQQDSAVVRVLFTPDGNSLAVLTEDGRLKLLRAVALQDADAQGAAR